MLALVKLLPLVHRPVASGRGALSSTRQGLSTSSASSDEPDKIHIRGIKLYGYHGALEEETRLGQTFMVDASISCSLSQAGKTDDLSTTINYARVFNTIQQVVAGPPRKLIETVAEEICHKILNQHPRASKIQIHLRKLCIPAVPSIVESVGVEIVRQRDSSMGK